MHSEYRPTTDHRRERYLSEPVRSIGWTSERARNERKRYLTTVPDHEHEQARAWLDTYGDLLHDEPLSDTLDKALGTSTHPFGPVLPSEQGQAWQQPVTLVTWDGEPVDLVGVWHEVLRHLVGEPVDDRSEHAPGTQRALEDRTVKALERGSLYYPTSTLGTTLDVTVTNGDEGVTHLVGEQRYHVEQAYAEQRKRTQRERNKARQHKHKAKAKAELAAVRAARAAREHEHERELAHDHATFDRKHATTYGS